MGTPATAFSSVIQSTVIWFGILWVSALAISRIYMFHDEYHRIVEHIHNDNRLREMCGEAEFLSIMKQHNDICSEVQHDAQVNPWLRALDKALNSPTLCGAEPCADIIGRWCVKGGWTGVGCCVLVFLFMPQVLMRLITLSYAWSVGQDAHPKMHSSPLYPRLHDYGAGQW